jgi:protein O-GlcNAc transferase
MSYVPIASAMEQARRMLQGGRFDQAAFVYRQVVQQQPANYEAQLHLGVALAQMGQLDEAERALREASRLRPNDPTPFANLGNVYRQRERLGEAIEAFETALKFAPSTAALYQNLGSAYRDAGRLDDAVASFRRALELQPSFHRVHSNLVYLLYYHPAYTSEAVFAEHQTWGRLHADPLRPADVVHANPPVAERRLRIGYVSPDLRNHVIGRYFEPLLEHHDRDRFEVFCYSDVARPDDLTARLRAQASAWRETRTLGDEQLADLVRRDGIDILVDLTLHMSGSRLLAFARKPAPVQITYLAYPGTSGMGAMDYKLTDVFLDPPGMTEKYHSESLLRLPASYWCYTPPPECPDVGPAPVLARGGAVTFAALNSFTKINGEVLRLWSKVLNATPRSRLMVLLPGGEHGNDATRAMFRDCGIADDRVVLLERRARADFLRYFGEADVSLDPFPYNGHTTTLDSLWIGVPVVTLEGNSAVGRAGVSVLSNLGMPGCVARTPEQYVEIAIRLANDPARLTELRKTLRQRMAASPLVDGARLAKDVEALYRRAWGKWCEK